jgi:hypothetical protein
MTKLKSNKKSSLFLFIILVVNTFSSYQSIGQNSYAASLNQYLRTTDNVTFGGASLLGDLKLGVNAEFSTISGQTNSGAIQIKSNALFGGAANRYLRLGWKDGNSVFYPVLSINDDQNVGIGTTTPQSKLQINNWANSDDFQTARQLVISGDNWGGLGLDQLGPAANKYGLEIGFHYKNGSESVKGGRIQAYSNGVTNLMLNPDGGNVGIGTTTPQAKLDVGAFIDNGQIGTVLGRLTEGNPTGDGTYLGVKGYGTNPANYNGKSFSIEHHFYGHTNSSINFFRGGGETGGFLTFNTSDNSEKMRIDPYGRVGIGTDSPDEMLTVKGKIHTNEVIIDMNAPIADYVFHPSYKLMPLTQVEQYVKTNSHLPEIPSAAEVSKNGMSIGEMQNKLLQKVEELTLYVIEQQKQIEAQQTEIKKLIQNK